MLSKILPFEQDREAIFLRNQEMHHHYSRLDSIKRRKNEYLPEIPPQKNFKGLKKNASSPTVFKRKQFFIQKDNKIILQKLDKINHRINQINNDSELIDGYLNEKKVSLVKFRELKNDLIQKENVKIKERIINTKPVIDNKIFDNDFQKLKKISVYLRKVKPQKSLGNVYLNRKESQILRKYEKERAEYNFKERGKENEFITKKNNFSNTGKNIITFKSNFKSNQYDNIPSNIDKKILKKIAYL